MCCKLHTPCGILNLLHREFEIQIEVYLDLGFGRESQEFESQLGSFIPGHKTSLLVPKITKLNEKKSLSLLKNVHGTCVNHH